MNVSNIYSSFYSSGFWFSKILSPIVLPWQKISQTSNACFFSAVQACGADCGEIHQKGKSDHCFIDFLHTCLSVNLLYHSNSYLFSSFQCKPEYKVAGLYVVDSIVRQSRHQFGADKDVFGPRFTKNITETFEHLCLCPVEDRVGYWTGLCAEY